MNRYAKRQDRCRMIVAGDGAERQPNGRYRLGHFALARIVLLGVGSLLASSLAFAQDSDFHRHNITFGLGAASPIGNATNYLATAPLVAIGYGYRFNRLFQADTGFQIAFGAANNQNAEVTDFGTLQGGDHEFMIPLGGRVFIPTRFKRFDVSAGAGTVYLYYSETVPQNGFYQNNCYSCTSRGGWGGYGLADISYFLDSNRNFHVGTTLQYIVGRTNGQPVRNVPGIQTTDHWVNLAFEFGLSF